MTWTDKLGHRAVAPFAKALPTLGDTERAALEARTVGFEGELFAGRPDFNALRRRGSNRLTAQEQAFLDHEVVQLCQMLDDDAIDQAHDLPAQAWQVMREKKYFGMIIPKEHGGLGFGHFAHATVVTRIATVNIAAAVTVMVPNSLGPAELLLRYGSDAQKLHDLPRLADGRELPCFGLTSPYAGSDASNIPDRGVLTERKIDGQMVRGFVLEFDKRYITLAPVATVVGLAFQAVDPSLPEGRQQLGITIALIPVPTPGLEIGRRHRPMNSAFMNGPVRREDDHGLHVLRNTGRALLGGGFRGQAPQGLRAEAARISRLSAQFALTADLAMGLLGGQLKRLELLSARLGDILSALYLASACLWRYEVEGNVRLLPVARAAVAHQMDTAQHALVDLHANLGPPVLRLLWPLLRLGAHRRRPVADRQLLALAESLRDDPALVDALCPDVVIPRQGGLADLARALALSKVVKDGLPALNKVLRRTRSLQEAAASARNPAAALACLQATDPVIPVDDFEA